MIKLSTRITTQVRFKKSLDLKMKEIATKEGKTKEKVYEEAILEFLKKSISRAGYPGWENRRIT